MMRLQIVSDLHLECDRAEFVLPETDADVVVLAGDIHENANGVLWARKLRSRGHRVVYVLGNHEFYGAEAHPLRRQLREVALKNGIDLLDDNALIIDGVRFLGTTLWTDFQLNGPDGAFQSMQLAGQVMNDFHVIRSADKAFTPLESVKLHLTAREWLGVELAKPFAGPTVVVTHHAPHPGSIHRRHESSSLSPAFASDLSEMINTYRPALMIHGHMHESVHYSVGETRIVCNPRGYFPDALNSDFNAALILEI